MARGQFISFEGSEGCGKSTQIFLLEERLRKERGVEILRTREPGGTVIGEHVRDLLQHTEGVENMTSECEMFLFAASRSQLVREKISPALDAGTWVIADRFVDSTTIYQGIGRGLGIEKLNTVSGIAVGETMPDITILLDMDAAVGHARAVATSAGEGPDRMENQPIEFFETVRSGYLELAKNNPDRIVVINAAQSIDEVADDLWSAIETRFDFS